MANENEGENRRAKLKALMEKRKAEGKSVGGGSADGGDGKRGKLLKVIAKKRRERGAEGNNDGDKQGPGLREIIKRNRATGSGDGNERPAGKGNGKLRQAFKKKFENLEKELSETREELAKLKADLGQSDGKNKPKVASSDK